MKVYHKNPVFLKDGFPNTNSHLSLYCSSAKAHMIAILRLIQKCAFCAGNPKMVADSWGGVHSESENNKQLSICVDKKCMHMQQGGFMGPGHGQRLTRNNMCTA